MKYYEKIVFALCLFLFSVCFQSQSYADDEASNIISYGYELDCNGNYIFRGLKYGNDFVFQPSFWLSAYGTTLSVWGNYDTGANEFNETDIYLSRIWETGKFSFEPSVAYYRYAGSFAWPSTAEMILKLSYSLTGALKIENENSLDVLEYPEAFYSRLGLSYSREIKTGMDYEIGMYAGLGSAAYNQNYIGLGIAAFNAVELTAAFIWQPLSGIYITPHIEWTSIQDAELRGLLSEPDIGNAGIKIGAQF